MTVRRWYLIHKWSSLVCMLFLLMLCVTGLPLIFHEELEEALGYDLPMPDVPAGQQPPTLDQIVAKVLEKHPGRVVQSLSFDADRPVTTVAVTPKPESPFSEALLENVDLRTGEFLSEPPNEGGFVWFMEQLHTTLFLDLPGTYFIGIMGTLFLVSLVSGAVIYAPFMRKLDFGAVRRSSVRLKWLDLHNFLGIATAAWLLVVGFTGVFNTLDRPLANQFRTGQLAEMTAPYANAPPLSYLGSLDAAVATARRASPGMEPATIAYPGTFFGTPHHYNVFMRGATPVTERLLKPTLVDAETGELTDTRDMPLHIRALFLSRPLHFGDYGGVFLKIVWAVFDLMAIFVLTSGLYLWVARWRAPMDRRFNDVEREAVSEGGA